LQFAPANATPKIAKEYVFANAENQAERKKASLQQCISVMRAKVLKLNELNINKHKAKPKVMCF